jgi:uncharacterized protein (DUF342 family)
MAQASAKGSLALTIDELGLEASLRFTPDPEGAEWTQDKLLRLVMDARVGGFTPKKADDVIGRFARSRGPLVEVLAKGLAPEEPVPEEAEWEALVPPPELDAVVAATIAASGAPELYKVRIETTRVERQVRKAAALPFLPAKVETVVEQQKHEVRERVYPDAEVQKTGFARKGDRLCILSPSKPGKAGKSIFGKPIPPKGKESTFLLGRGVLRNKNEITAAEDGVVRAGSRWVEVIPLAMPSWGVTRSADGATVFLSLEPGDPRLPSPDPAAIMKAALELGVAADTLIPVDSLAAIVKAAREAGEQLFSRSLSLDRDGSAEVVASPDGLRAVLNVRKGRGSGKPLTLAMVTDALKASGLRVAKAEQLKKDIVEFYRSDRSDLLDYPIAEGRAPTRGKDRTVSLDAAFHPADKVAELKERLAGHPFLAMNVPSLDEFPIAATTRIAAVQAGQRFGELSASAAGQPGVDIKGNALPGIPGNDPRIRTYENVEFARGCLTALVSGLLFTQEEGDNLRFRVLPFRDSSVEVSVAADGMTAFLNLQSEVGLGRPLTVEGALEALAAKGVVQGVDPRAVADAIAASRAGRSVLRHPVAHGRPARPAGSASRVWLVGAGAPYLGEKPAGGGPIRVAPGSPVLRIETKGGSAEAGIDVLGRPIAAPDAVQALPPAATIGHDASIREEATADGSVTYSAVAGGELRLDGQKLSVIERFVVKGDVGPDIGNVRFAGPIHVHGSVRRGFQLFAGGDAAIAGAVEAALVSSDGAVSIGGGIRGDRRGTIRARKTVDVGFAEQALILAVDDIRVRGSCALCSVKTNGRLVVGVDSGSLVGGLTRCRKGVDAAALGSENGIKTEVSFGQDYLVADMIEAEEREIEKLKGLVLQSDRAMADAERTGVGLDRVRQDKVKLMKLLEKRSIRLFDLREKFEEHFAAAEVRVRGTVHPGVILESHNRFYEVRSRKSNVVFTFDQQQGRIVERQL